MDARIYQDFQPKPELVKEESCDTFVIDLPGFKKEELSVQLDNSGNLKISGKRRIDSNNWSRFRTALRVAQNCNFNDVRAKFDNGKLHVIMPKNIADVQPMPSKVAISGSLPGNRWYTRASTRLGMHKPRNLVVNVMAAVVVVAALGVFIAYKLKSPEEIEKLGD